MGREDWGAKILPAMKIIPDNIGKYYPVTHVLKGNQQCTATHGKCPWRVADSEFRRGSKDCGWKRSGDSTELAGLELVFSESREIKQAD